MHLREVTVGPSYPPELIHRVIRRNLGSLRRCVGDLPSLSPLGTLIFSIESDGLVQDARFENSGGSTEPNRAQQCVLEAIRAMEFVPPGGRLQVRYPMGSDPSAAP